MGRDCVSSTVNRNLRGKRGVVESKATVDEARAMFWLRERGDDSRRDSQELGAAFRRASQKQVEDSVRGFGQVRARSLGRGDAGEISLTPPVVFGVQN